MLYIPNVGISATFDALLDYTAKISTFLFAVNTVHDQRWVVSFFMPSACVINLPLHRKGVAVPLEPCRVHDVKRRANQIAGL